MSAPTPVSKLQQQALLHLTTIIQLQQAVTNTLQMDAKAVRREALLHQQLAASESQRAVYKDRYWVQQQQLNCFIACHGNFRSCTT